MQYKNGLAKAENGTYQYKFRLGGRQWCGSTKAKDLATARRVLDGLRREILTGQRCPGKQSPPPEKPRPVVMTTSELVSAWMLQNEPVMSAKHIKSVKDSSKNWIVPTFGETPIGDITTDHVLSLRDAILDAGRSRATVNHILQAVRLLWNFAVSIGQIAAAPRIKMLKLQRKPRPTVPAEQVREFLAVVDRSSTDHVRLIVRCMIGLGLREGEGLGMRWEWLDTNNATYTVGKAKGREARVLPIPGWLMTELEKLPYTSEWLFPAEDGQPHRPGLCRKAICRAASAISIEGKLTQHRLRATFASLHAASGTPISEIQGMLGHKSALTTMVYIETSLAARKLAQDRLSVVLGL